MITKQTQVTYVATKVAEDLKEYLGSFVSGQDGFLPALDEAVSSEFPDRAVVRPQPATSSTLVPQVESLIDRVEQAHRTGPINWGSKASTQIVFRAFQSALEKLVASDMPSAPTHFIKKFAESLVNRVQQTNYARTFIRFIEPPTDHPLAPGFVSWLYARATPAPARDLYLHVFYNKSVLDTKASIDLATVSRYERVYLHEIAHARLHVPFPLPTQFVALPAEEAEAWLYVALFRGHVIGLKSRISRILGDGDGGWQS